MKQKCIETITKIIDDIDELSDGLSNLRAAVEDDDEDKIEPALDSFPTPKSLTKTLEQLGKLIETRPWEDKRKKANA